MPDFGRLKPLELRNIWPHEASSFTPWLAEHLPALGEALGVDLELQDIEAEVGDFSLDILAKDLGTGRTVVIENQLTSTDHDHLGKLLTYAAGHNAGTVIWVARSIRDEHRQALEWLNQRTDKETGFFAVTVSVFQIDDSKPAFEFLPVVFPNEWQKASLSRKDTTGRGEAYRAFFQNLIDVLRTQHRFTSAKIGQPQNWYNFPTGISGLTYGATFAQGGKIRTELYIDVGNGGVNKAIFDRLFAERKNIETAFGGVLEWERMDAKQASRVAVYRPGSIQMPPEQLSELSGQIIGSLLRLKAALSPSLRKVVEAAR